MGVGLVRTPGFIYEKMQKTRKKLLLCETYTYKDKIVLTSGGGNDSYDTESLILFFSTTTTIVKPYTIHDLTRPLLFNNTIQFSWTEKRSRIS